jgi:putative ubiquitin-RnfH superfamily antitoxin RatB of RatAB toxin-antitoxin module
VRVEVVYALPLEQDVTSLEVTAGTTLREAITRSGVLGRHPEIDLGSARVGVWGRSAPLDGVLRDGDRVEVYRPLRADPGTARRRRAAKSRA